MTPELRDQKKEHIRVVFNSAIGLLEAGNRDAAFDALNKLLGMQAAFHRIDDELMEFIKLAVDAFVIADHPELLRAAQ
ncbi:hypothetical protein [Marinobacter sp. SS21]|uniref:hypothetical protein n=1 Tax=Marinobacter sp. SS21 TaxID=2979460 RepID=UPI00232FAEED|nr:hypothetical protein [Marinobacter sp. SS21]MDC0664365.1 hypothetical protein [Marinobacter sp. SS21]